MSAVESLLEQMLDDRESLSEEQWEQLLEAVRQSPELLARLKDHLLMDEALSQQMAVDRGNFPAQVAQRLRDSERDSAELLSQVEEMRSLAFEELVERRPRRRPLLRGALAAAALLIAVAAGAWYVVPGVGDRAQVTRVYGAASLIRDDVQQPLVAGQQLRYGDRLLTEAKAFAVLAYPDGTQLNVGDRSLLQFSSRFRSGKVVEVDRGAVASHVAPQPKGRPMRFLTPRADAKVVGTELLLEVTNDQTRLNVAQGQVELKGLSGGRGVIVAARQFGVSDGGKVDVQALAWPTQLDALQAVVEPGGESPPPAWELRGDAAWHGGRFRFRGGSAVAPAADSQQLVNACRSSGQLSLELVLQCDSLLQGPVPIVSLSTEGGDGNFKLSQDGAFLVFRIGTRVDGEAVFNPEIRVCRLRDRRAHHLLLTYDGGRLNGYLDGEQVLSTDKMKGDLAMWTSHYLTLADRWNAASGDGWHGEVRALAIYDRALDSQKALRHAAALRSWR